MIAEKMDDIISNLPNEIIHHILSFLDLKYAIQTSALSKRWKHIWTSLPHLNLNNQSFRTLPKFVKFMKNALAHRNHHTQVSAVELSFRGSPAQFDAAMTSIVNFAYSHNVHKLTLVWVRFREELLNFQQRQHLFSCHTLKHLTLATNTLNACGISVPKSAWDFPALETLYLSHLRFDGDGDKSLNLFSQCVNLKDLTLHGYNMYDLDIFNVCAPQLSNLTITNPHSFPKVFNVVAPKLESLTASVMDRNSVFLQLSVEDLDSLEKVNLSMQPTPWLSKEERYAPELQDLFQKLCRAKFLILDNGIIKVLSACLNQLSDEPCPFNNLKRLKSIETMPTPVRNYFLDSSPSATFVMDLPQVPRKRSRQEARKETMAKKVARLEKEKQIMAEEKRMLEAKIKMQDGVIAEQKAMMLRQEILTSQMIDCKMAELQVQIAGGDPGYELIRLIKSIMELTPEGLRVAMEAQVSSLYEEMKSLFFTSIDASEWEKIELELGITERNRSDNNVPAAAAALQLVSSPSSADVVTSSSIANAWSG